MQGGYAGGPDGRAAVAGSRDDQNVTVAAGVCFAGWRSDLMLRVENALHCEHGWLLLLLGHTQSGVKHTVEASDGGYV